MFYIISIFFTTKVKTNPHTHVYPTNMLALNRGTAVCGVWTHPWHTSANTRECSSRHTFTVSSRWNSIWYLLWLFYQVYVLSRCPLCLRELTKITSLKLVFDRTKACRPTCYCGRISGYHDLSWRPRYIYFMNSQMRPNALSRRPMWMTRQNWPLFRWPLLLHMKA